MENIPASLRFYVSQIANVQKVRVKLQSLNQTSIGSSGASQLRCALPVSSVLNMNSLAFHARFESESPYGESAAGAANAIYALCPRMGLQSCIERIQWSAGGISLSSGETPYHLIANMKTDICESSDKYMTDTRVLNNATISPWKNNAAGNPLADTKRGQRRDLILTDMLGWTNGKPEMRDASLFPEQFVEITAAGSHVLPVQGQGKGLGDFINMSTTAAQRFNTNFTGNGCNYTLSQCYFSIETLSIGSGLYDGVTEALLEQRGSLDVPFKTFVSVSSPSSSPGASVRGAVSTICLDKLYATMLNNARPPDSANVPGANDVQYYPYNLQQPPRPCPDSTTYGFTHVTACRDGQGVKDWQFRVNSAPSPMYSISGGVESFMMTQAGEDRQYVKNAGGLVSSVDMFNKNCFAATVSYALTNSHRSLDGMNLQSINSQIEFNSTEDTEAPAGQRAARQVYLVAECTSLARVGMSRALAIVK